MRGDTAAAAAAGNGAPKPENLLSEKQWPGTWSNYHAGETPGSRLRDASSSPRLIPTRRGEPRPRVAFTTPESTTPREFRIRRDSLAGIHRQN